jgi:hypothetical protein
MAGIAIQGSMGADQREAVLMLLYLLNGNVPALDVVALLAIGAKLAAVDIGVAVGALDPDIGEQHFGVALRAGDILVHAA